MQHLSRAARPRLPVMLGVLGLAALIAVSSALIVHRRSAALPVAAGHHNGFGWTIPLPALHLPAVVVPAVPAAPTPAPDGGAPAAGEAAGASSGGPTGAPARLVIGSIGVNAPIDSVGLDRSGALDVPRGWNDVAWFTGGAIPGQPGLAIIDGHLDSTTGPAVFWRLAQVHPGDQLAVVSGDGSRTTFRVTGSGSVPAGSSGWSAGVFDKSGPARLTLITCSGSWDRAAHQYRQRLVVNAVLAA